MKIPLSLLNDQLQVNAVIRAPKYRLGMGVISFIVDTGSNKSMVGYGDIERLNIPESALPFEEYCIIGGGRLELHALNDVTLTFEGADGKAQMLQLARFAAGIPTKKNAEEREKAKWVPSLLGLDFLVSHLFTLVVNPAKNEYYLER